MEYKLSDIFNLQMGKTPSRNNSVYWTEGKYDWISISDLSSEKYINKTKEKITDSAIEKTNIKIIPANTVIMSFKLSIGKTAITSHDMYSNEAIMAFIDKHKVELNTDFIYYLLQSVKWNTNTAVKGKTINKSIISKTKVNIPDYQEQCKIVKVLDIVTKRLKFEQKELINLDELIKARFVEMFGDPINNQKGWKILRIEDLVENNKYAIKAGPFGSALKKEFYVSKGYKIYGQEQVIKNDPSFGNYYISQEKYTSLKNYRVKAGDVLISLVGTYGKLMIMPDDYELGIINPRLIKITFDKDLVNPIYFKYFFQSDAEKKVLTHNTHGGTMGILNVKIIRKVALPLPPLALQNEFANFVQQVDKSKVAVQKSLDETQKLFDSLMQEYFG